MKLKLYIGAHKTATTHVQQLLTANKQMLSDNNIHLSTPPSIRPLWFPFLTQYAISKDSSTIKKILSSAPSSGTWIFAEENISGVPHDLKVKPGIYPHIADNVNVFKELFPNAELEIFFSIRSYASFYTSSYLEVVRNRGFFPFEEFYDETRYKNNSWLKVINSLITTLSDQDQLTLWRYEDFPDLLPQILERLTGLSPLQSSAMVRNYSAQKTRQSISKKTLELIATAPLQKDKQQAKKLLEELNLKFPASDKNGYFTPFTIEQTLEFQNQYEKDLDYLTQEQSLAKLLTHKNVNEIS